MTEGGSAVEGGVRVEESILLCWGLDTRRICEEGKRRRRVLISILAECVALWGKPEQAVAGVSKCWNPRSHYLRILAVVCPLVEYFASPTPNFRLIRAVHFLSRIVFCQEDSMRLISSVH